jgi:transcriptional regulator with XRE-family HTH domain
MGLRSFRQQRGLSLDAISVLAGIDPSTVSKIERGLVEPRPETIVKLARGLGVSARRMRDIIVEGALERGEPVP